MTSYKRRKSGVTILSSPDIGSKAKIREENTNQNLVDEFETLFNKIDDVRRWTQNLLDDALNVVCVDDNARIDKYLETSDKRHLGKTKLEILGVNMTKASRGFGIKGGQYARVLAQVGQTEIKLGGYDRDFIVDVCSGFILPLKYFLEVELNKLTEEREMLISRKTDYDYYSRQSTDNKRFGNKLKMAQMALKFQFEHAKEALTKIDASECQVGHLSDLVNAQSIYHRKCLSELDKLKTELAKSSSKIVESTVKNAVFKGEEVHESKIVPKIVQNRRHDSEPEPRVKSHLNCSRKPIARCQRSEISAIAHQKESPQAAEQMIVQRENIVEPPNLESKGQSETAEQGTKSCPRHSEPEQQSNNGSLDGTTTPSTSSRETQVIRLPTRNDYRKTMGKIFFTPREEME